MNSPEAAFGWNLQRLHRADSAEGSRGSTTPPPELRDDKRSSARRAAPALSVGPPRAGLHSASAATTVRMFAAPLHPGAGWPSHSSRDIPLRPETSTSVAAHCSCSGTNGERVASSELFKTISTRRWMDGSRVWSSALRRCRPFLQGFRPPPPQPHCPARELLGTATPFRPRSRLPAASRR